MKNFELLNELLTKQLKDISADKKLRLSDLQRLCKYLDANIFDANQCSLWKGYITNAKNESKGIYINFYFNGSKVALHRLLYANFVDTLSENEYLKFTCENKGKCCNINHLQKFSYVAHSNKPIKQTKLDNQNTDEILTKNTETYNGHTLTSAYVGKQNKISRQTKKKQSDDITQFTISFD